VTNADLILLLQVVHSNQFVGSLLRKGYLYHQIAAMVDECVHRGFLVYDGESLVLTREGKQFRENDPDTGKVRRDGGWISPAEASRVPKLSDAEIFLPNNKTVEGLFRP